MKTFLFPEGNYADQGDFKPWPRQVSNTNDLQPRMLLSEPLPAGLYAFRIPPAGGRFRVSFFTNLVDANVAEVLLCLHMPCGVLPSSEGGMIRSVN